MKKKKWTENSHHILEQASNIDRYNRWLMSQFYPFFAKSILEIGSGTGALSKLLPKNHAITLSDVQQNYVNFLSEKFPQHRVVKLNIQKEIPNNLHTKFDTIFSSNVFEHLEKDHLAFKNCLKMLKPKGRLLLFVPACQSIYGELDRQMGHYRRYQLKDIVYKAQKAGFVIEQVKYVNAIGYLTWWGRGVLLGRIIKNNPGKNSADNFLARFFDMMIVPMLAIEKHITLPFGQSIVLVAKKV